MINNGPRLAYPGIRIVRVIIFEFSYTYAENPVNRLHGEKPVIFSRIAGRPD